MENYRGLALDGFQREAIEAIARGESVLVAAPTGAGKTLIAEYAIERALATGRRIVYTAPVKALSNQKFRDFTTAWGNEVGIMTGDVTVNPGGRALIMTTEIFRNTIFESPERLADVSHVIFDEVHYLDDPDRGTVWEESIIFAPPSIGIVALSATVSNLDELAGWIRSVRGGTLAVVRETRRPVPLQSSIFSVEGGLRDARLVGTEGFLGPGAGGRRHHDPPGRWGRGVHDHRRDEGGGGGGMGRQAFATRQDLALLDLLEERDHLPCIFFLFSRDACERLAMACLDRRLLDQEEERRMEALVSSLVRAYELEDEPEAQRLHHLATRGVAYHHAGMLPTLKEIVERLFTSGLVKLLFATETFALGVNMPARAVAFEELRKWNGVARVPLRCREFQQMSGRAGRRGKDAAGFVYACVNPARDHPAQVDTVLHGAVEPVRSQFALSYSTLLKLFDRLGEDLLYRACEKSLLAYHLAHGPHARREAERGDTGGGLVPARPRKGSRSHELEWDRPGRGHPRYEKVEHGRDRGRDNRGRGHGRGRGRDGAGRSRSDLLPAGPLDYGGMVDQVRRRIALLRDLGYIDGRRLTRRGQFAALVHGFDVQATELVFGGVLDALDPARLAVLASAVVFEPRRDDAYSGGADPRRLLGDAYRRAIRTNAAVRRREEEGGIRNPIRPLELGIAGVTWAWAQGAEFAALKELTDLSDGDVVRTMRLVIQLLRQLHEPLRLMGPASLAERVGRSIALVKRGVVDAEWQLRRGESIEEGGDREERGASAREPEPRPAREARPNERTRRRDGEE